MWRTRGRVSRAELKPGKRAGKGMGMGEMRCVDVWVRGVGGGVVVFVFVVVFGEGLEMSKGLGCEWGVGGGVREEWEEETERE